MIIKVSYFFHSNFSEFEFRQAWTHLAKFLLKEKQNFLSLLSFLETEREERKQINLPASHSQTALGDENACNCRTEPKQNVQYYVSGIFLTNCHKINI